MTAKKITVEPVTFVSNRLFDAGECVRGRVEYGKRTILGNDSEDLDTIKVKVEPTGPGGFHDETLWADPHAWSLMRRGVRSARGDGSTDWAKSADGDQP